MHSVHLVKFPCMRTTFRTQSVLTVSAQDVDYMYSSNCSTWSHSFSSHFRVRRVCVQALKQAGIPYVVAPYEADAQMAYMARSGIVDLVITEDSDLLAYGCPEVVFKLQRSGDCDHVRIVDLPMNRTLSFSGMDHDNFIEVRHIRCIIRTSVTACTSEECLVSQHTAKSYIAAS